jgi:hypothetical protein
MQEPVFIADNSNTSSSTEDDNSIKPSSYESSYSSNSTESDPVRCYNKLKRQGSRSSIIVPDGNNSVQSKQGTHERYHCDTKRVV